MIQVITKCVYKITLLVHDKQVINKTIVNAYFVT